MRRAARDRGTGFRPPRSGSSATSARALARILTFAAALLVGGLSSATSRSDLPPGFVDLHAVAPTIALDIRYAGPENFVGRRIHGYDAARCYLTRSAAEALALVQSDLAGRGLGLKVFDCYRPARAVDDFDRWARDVADVARKRDYYPAVDKRDLFRLGYIGKNSSHTRGSTVDLTLIDRATGRELEMGTGFDFMGERSAFGHRSVSAEASGNRAILRAAMGRRGFSAYAKEWWHYTLRDEPFPKTYFDFPVR